MTVGVVVKVYDGIVLAADSATTLPLQDGGSQVYNNANKIFHLHRTKPVAAMTWGMGSIGSASIATLAKDLRRRFTGKDAAHLDWELADDYTVQGVAERLVEMMFDELFVGEGVADLLGFLVAGYSGEAAQAEAWLVTLTDPAVRPIPQIAAGPDQGGWVAYAQPEAASRLINGCDGDLVAALHAAVPEENHADLQAVLYAGRREACPPAMPFADAIAFARFLVDTTVGYRRFLLGPDTVGGPIEVAGISRHEGFKWISRKHYYSPALNPEDPHHDY